MNEQLLNFWQRYQDTRGLWIGLSDAENEGVFVWASGWLWVDPNWVPFEPDGGRGKTMSTWTGSVPRMTLRLRSSSRRLRRFQISNLAQ